MLMIPFPLDPPTEAGLMRQLLFIFIGETDSTISVKITNLTLRWLMGGGHTHHWFVVLMGARNYF